MNFNALQHLVSQAYLMKTKLLYEILGLENDLGLRQGLPVSCDMGF